jgi:hypothetical protein
MKTPRFIKIAGLSGMVVVSLLGASADPIITCWQTDYAGQYARVYTNAAMQTAGTSLTTWANSSLSQSQPAYAGIQEIYSGTTGYTFARPAWPVSRWDPGRPAFPTCR